jgi:hypothetical protein
MGGALEFLTFLNLSFGKTSRGFCYERYGNGQLEANNSEALIRCIQADYPWWCWTVVAIS